MEVNPSDLQFPKAVISRIIKEALPEGIIVSKEAKNAIGRSAAIFILHATSLANDNAQSKKRKNVTADDILYAVRQLECDELEGTIKESLDLFNQKKNQRQQKRKERRAEKAAQNSEKLKENQNDECNRNDEEHSDEVDDEDDGQIEDDDDQ